MASVKQAPASNPEITEGIQSGIPGGISGNGESPMSSQSVTNSAGNAAGNSEDLWGQAPDAPLIPWLSNEQRAHLVNSRATVNVVGMDYERTGAFGPQFVATIIAPDDDSAYKISFTSRGGKTPRDQINKWMFDLINKQHKSPIPAQLVKNGRAYSLAKPGSPTDADGTVTADEIPPANYDEPEF